MRNRIKEGNRDVRKQRWKQGGNLEGDSWQNKDAWEEVWKREMWGQIRVDGMDK